MAQRNRRRDSSGHVDPHFRTRPRYKAVFELLGLWDLFLAVPRMAQESFFLGKYPDPILELDPPLRSDAEFRNLRDTLEERYREASIVALGGQITVRDFLTVVVGSEVMSRNSLKLQGIPESCARFLAKAAPLLDQLFEQGMPRVWSALYSALVVPLLGLGRLDARLPRLTFQSDETPHLKKQFRMTLRSESPQMRHVSIDGALRPIFRVGTTYEWNDLRWLSWNWDHCDDLQTKRDYPVYVQSHALRRLHERANLPRIAGFLETWLYTSLNEPNIIERDGRDLLVEFRAEEYRLGYLVVTPIEDQGGLVLVRTFKFLTMENMPEARRLRRQMQLTRRDIDWLGLHDLAAFTQTDLGKDEQLRGLFEKCGCGHLFTLADDDFAPQPKPFAAEVRKYLRMAA